MRWGRHKRRNPQSVAAGPREQAVEAVGLAKRGKAAVARAAAEFLEMPQDPASHRLEGVSHAGGILAVVVWVVVAGSKVEPGFAQAQGLGAARPPTPAAGRGLVLES